jgi:catechol 2,3-dioxygenase-like lactoylglutathione lyase family enzyme
VRRTRIGDIISQSVERNEPRAPTTSVARTPIVFPARPPSSDPMSAAPSLRNFADVVLLDFWGRPTDEPVVFGWMPAASLYFRDPDGNMLELFSMLLTLHNQNWEL